MREFVAVRMVFPSKLNGDAAPAEEVAFQDHFIPRDVYNALVRGSKIEAFLQLEAGIRQKFDTLGGRPIPIHYVVDFIEYQRALLEREGEK